MLSAGLVTARDNLKGFATSIGSVGDTIKGGLEDPMDAAKRATVSALEAMGPFGIGLAAVGVSATAAGAALFEMADQAAAAGEAQLNFSRITGAAVADVGALSAAATIGGSSLDGLQSMLMQVQRRMDATGPAADKFNAALKDLGINAEAFRAADPSARIGILSDAMHAAAGSTTMMSDALAIMGRGALTNLPFLMKNFDDLKAKGEEVGLTLSVADVHAAEQLGEATRSLGVQMSTAADTIGTALVPAATAAAVVMSDLFGFFVGLPIAGVTAAVHGLTDAFGGAALTSQQLGAAVDTMNTLLAAAKKAGLDDAAATDAVASSMLSLGYSVAKVSALTGENSLDLKLLALNLKDAKDASDAYDAAMGRVNDSYGNSSNSIHDVSQALQDYVAELKNNGVELADIVTVTGLTTTQINLLTSAQAKAEAIAAKNDTTLQHLADTLEQRAAKAAAEWAKVLTDVSDATYGLHGALDSIDGAIVDWAEHLLKSGVTAKEVALYYGLTDEQVKALEHDMKTATQATNEWTEALRANQAAREAQDKEGAKNLKTYNDTNNAIMGLDTSFKGWNAAVMGTDKNLQQVAADLEKIHNLGNTITYDLSNPTGLQGYKTLNPGATFTWTDAEIMAFFQKGGSLASLIQAGIINVWGTSVQGNIGNQPQIPHYAAGGPTGAGGPAMLHPDEYVVPQGGALVRGGGGATTVNVNMTVQGVIDASGRASLAKIVSDEIMKTMKSVRQLGSA